MWDKNRVTRTLCGVILVLLSEQGRLPAWSIYFCGGQDGCYQNPDRIASGTRTDRRSDYEFGAFGKGARPPPRTSSGLDGGDRKEARSPAGKQEQDSHHSKSDGNGLNRGSGPVLAVEQIFLAHLQKAVQGVLLLLPNRFRILPRSKRPYHLLVADKLAIGFQGHLTGIKLQQG